MGRACRQGDGVQSWNRARAGLGQHRLAPAAGQRLAGACAHQHTRLPLPRADQRSCAPQTCQQAISQRRGPTHRAVRVAALAASCGECKRRCTCGTGGRRAIADGWARAPHSSQGNGLPRAPGSFFQHLGGVFSGAHRTCRHGTGP